MAMPTVIWARTLDPTDLSDFRIDVSNGLLEPGESFTSYTLALSAEAVALGLEVGTGIYAPVSDGEVIDVWFSINPALRSNAAFNGEGATLLMELTLETDADLPRRWQRTIGLKVAQQ